MDATSLLIRLKFWQKKGIEGILLDESARIEDSIAKFARMIYSSFIHGCDIIVNLIEILAKERNGKNSLGQKCKNRGFDREVCKDDLFVVR